MIRGLFWIFCLSNIMIFVCVYDFGLVVRFRESKLGYALSKKILLLKENKTISKTISYNS